MRFLKETITIILIVIFVFAVNIITENITKSAISEINNEINVIEGDINNNEDNINENVGKLKDKWNQKEYTLSFFVEHSELEKVSSNMVLIETNIENGKIEESLEKIAEIKFLLNHIEEKNKFKLNNVF